MRDIWEMAQDEDGTVVLVQLYRVFSVWEWDEVSHSFVLLFYGLFIGLDPIYELLMFTEIPLS